MITSTRNIWRIYFNRHGADPLMWCVSGGEFEICVSSVAIDVPSWFVYKAKAVCDEDDGKPSGWVECDGVLRISPNGRATIAAP